MKRGKGWGEDPLGTAYDRSRRVKRDKGGRRVVPEEWTEKLRERAGDKGVIHMTAFGARDRYSRKVMRLVAAQGELDARAKAIVEAGGAELKIVIAEDKELQKAYWNALREGVKLGDRTCLELYTRILKLADQEKTVVVTILHQLGMQSMEDLERMVRTHKDMEGVTPEQRASACADYLELYLNANPGERLMFVRRFGGEVPVTSDSYAQVVK